MVFPNPFSNLRFTTGRAVQTDNFPNTLPLKELLQTDIHPTFYHRLNSSRPILTPKPS